MYSSQKKSVIKSIMHKTKSNLPYATEALIESNWNKEDAVDYIKDGRKKPSKKKKYHVKG